VLEHLGRVTIAFEDDFASGEALLDVRLPRLPRFGTHPADQEVIAGRREGDVFVFDCQAGAYEVCVLCREAPPLVFLQDKRTALILVGGQESAHYVLPAPRIEPRRLPCRFEGDPGLPLSACTLRPAPSYGVTGAELGCDAAGLAQVWLPVEPEEARDYLPMEMVYSWDRGPRGRGLAYGSWERDKIEVLPRRTGVLRFGELLLGATELEIDGMLLGERRWRGAELDAVRSSGVEWLLPDRLRIRIEYQPSAAVSALELSSMVKPEGSDIDLAGNLVFADRIITLQHGPDESIPVILRSPSGSRASEVSVTASLRAGVNRLRIPVWRNCDLGVRGAPDERPGRAVVSQIARRGRTVEGPKEIDLELVRWRFRCVDCSGSAVPFASVAIQGGPVPTQLQADAEGRFDVYLLRGDRHRLQMDRSPFLRGQYLLRWDVEPPEISDLLVSSCTPTLEVHVRGTRPLHTVRVRLEEAVPEPNAEGLYAVPLPSRSCDSRGRVEFRGIPAGHYRVIAFTGERLSRGTLAETSVEVTEGEGKVQVELEI